MNALSQLIYSTKRTCLTFSPMNVGGSLWGQSIEFRSPPLPLSRGFIYLSAIFGVVVELKFKLCTYLKADIFNISTSEALGAQNLELILKRIFTPYERKSLSPSTNVQKWLMAPVNWVRRNHYSWFEIISCFFILRPWCSTHREANTVSVFINPLL